MFILASSIMFCGFKSRCITSFDCRMTKACTNQAAQITVTCCDSFLRSEIRLAKSPFSQFSKIKYKYCASIVVAISLITQADSSSFNSSFSLKMCLTLPSFWIYSWETIFIATTLPVVFSRPSMTLPQAPYPNVLPSSKSSIVYFGPLSTVCKNSDKTLHLSFTILNHI